MPRSRLHHGHAPVGSVGLLSMGGLAAATIHSKGNPAAAATPEDLSVDQLVARYGSKRITNVKALPSMQQMDIRHKKTLEEAGLSSLASDIDTVVFGRDLDNSAHLVGDVRECDAFRGAHGKTSKALGFETLQAKGGVVGGYVPDDTVGHEAKSESSSPGVSPTRSSKRMLTDAGMCRQASVVDEVIFGRDLDGSGEQVIDVRQGRAFRDAQGKTSAQLGQAQLEASSSVLDLQSKRHFLPPPAPSSQLAAVLSDRAERAWSVVRADAESAHPRPDPTATVHARRAAKRRHAPKLGPRELRVPEAPPNEYGQKRSLARARTRINLDGELQAASQSPPPRRGPVRPSPEPGAATTLASPASLALLLRRARAAPSPEAAPMDTSGMSPPAANRRLFREGDADHTHDWPPRFGEGYGSEGAAFGRLRGEKAAEVSGRRPLAGLSCPELHRHETDDFRPLKLNMDAGLCRHASKVDEVIFGRDLDGSAELVSNVRQGRAFRDAQGKTSAQLGRAQLEASSSVLDLQSKRHLRPPGAPLPGAPAPNRSQPSLPWYGRRY